MSGSLDGVRMTKSVCEEYEGIEEFDGSGWSEPNNVV